MAVEDLLGSYSQGQFFLLETMIKRKESGQKLSSIDIVANTFADEGRQNLLQTTQEIKERKLKVDFNSKINVFRQLPPDLSKLARLGFVSVIFGSSVLSIKKTVAEKVFSPSQLLMHFNFLVDETFIPKFSRTIMNAVPISPQRSREYNKAAHLDPSLSIFFTQAWHLTPELIRKLITDTGSLPIIRARFIPSYKDKVIKLTNHFLLQEKDKI